MPGLASGKIVVVTGGASGIGQATAEAFAAEGAEHVVVADIDEPGASATAERIGEAGGSASIGAVDVTDEPAVAALMDGVVADHGRIDIAFNNAGITDSPGAFEDLGRDR